MNLRFLKLFMKIGSIFSITPNYDITSKPESLFYCCFLGVLATCALLVKVVKRAFFSSKPGFFSLMFEVNVYVYTIHLLYSCVTKKYQWWKLISLLKRQDQKSKCSLFEYLIFFQLLISFWILEVPCSYSMFFQNDFLYILSRLLKYFQTYCQYVICLIIHICLSMFLQKYRLITQNLEKAVRFVTFGSSKSKSYIKLIPVMCKEKLSILVLQEEVVTFNEIFQWQMFMNLSLIIAMYLMYLRVFLKDERWREAGNFCKIGKVILRIIWTIDIIYLCHQISQEVEQILFKATRFCNGLIKNDVALFVESVEKNYPHFSAARFFKISLATLLTTCSTVLTFTIFLVQFDAKEKSYKACNNTIKNKK